MRVVSELGACQRWGDGYVAGFTRKNDSGAIEPGRRVFEEVSRGEIRSARFNLNGSWSPFYNWHKLMAGLLDAHFHCGSVEALGIASSLAAYIDRSLAPLDEARMQAAPGTEFGGMNGAAEPTRAPRTLAGSRSRRFTITRFSTRAGADELSYLHSNTQIPKVMACRRRRSTATRRTARRPLFWRWCGRSLLRHRRQQRPGEFQGQFDPALHHRADLQSCNTTQHAEADAISTQPSGCRVLRLLRARALNHVLRSNAHRRHVRAHGAPRAVPRRWSDHSTPFWCCSARA
jgi:hypothetical protein